MAKRRVDAQGVGQGVGQGPGPPGGTMRSCRGDEMQAGLGDGGRVDGGFRLASQERLATRASDDLMILDPDAAPTTAATAER